MPEAPTFSSAQHRERDKRIEEKHQQEIRALERKIEVIRRSNEDTRKQLFDVVQRAENFAHTLGYSNVLEAQEALELMEPGFNLRTCSERMSSLEKALEQARDEAELYSQQVDEAIIELSEWKAKHKEQA